MNVGKERCMRDRVGVATVHPPFLVGYDLHVRMHSLGHSTIGL